MNALSILEANASNAVGLNLPATISFDQWIQVGSELSTQRRNVDWMIGDWLTHGQNHFADQYDFDFLADKLGIAPKRLKTVARVADLFPAHKRAADLTIDHHAHVAGLPEAEAYTLLSQAHDRHWTAEELRIEAVKAKATIRQPELLRDDPEYDELMAMVRPWNRACPEVRAQFVELINESAMGYIEA